LVVDVGIDGEPRASVCCAHNHPEATDVRNRQAQPPVIGCRK